LRAHFFELVPGPTHLQLIPSQRPDVVESALQAEADVVAAAAIAVRAGAAAAAAAVVPGVADAFVVVVALLVEAVAEQKLAQKAEKWNELWAERCLQTAMTCWLERPNLERECLPQRCA